jgi:hypothetical protein
MSMVEPKDVGVGVGQQPNHSKPVVLPVLPWSIPPPVLPNQTVSPATAPQLPQITGHTPTKLDQRPLTSQQEEAQQTSATWERINQAGRTTTRYLTWGTIGAGIVYTLWLLNGAAAGLAGALLPPELRENNPLAPPRPTQG